jgi:hypothetical protein
VTKRQKRHRALVRAIASRRKATPNKSRRTRVADAVALVRRGSSIRAACLKTGAGITGVTKAATKAGLRKSLDRAAESRSSLAAKWAADHGGRLSDAADRFDVSAEAVRQQWRALFGARPTPWRADVTERARARRSR